jgi:four helix bundle protein
MGKFEDLEVWKKAARLSGNIYKELRNLKDYGFKDQITRSGLSIPSNIAEGIERNSDKETLTFLAYAKGSSAELRTQVYIGIDIGYIPTEIGKSWIEETKGISAMLVGLIKSIQNTTANSKPAGPAKPGNSRQKTEHR